MDKMVVIAFDNEDKAYEATRALKELHGEGSLALYAMAVVAKDADGKVTVKEAADEGPLGTAVGMLVGTMVGLIAGPTGAAVGLTTGALLGATADLAKAGVDGNFLEEVDGALEPGKVAVVAEAAENWVTPLDSRMEEIGGVVLRRSRVDYVDELIDRDIAETKADLDRLKEEYQQATGDAKAKLKAKMDATQASLDSLAEHAKERSETMKREADAKVEALEAQAQKANADTRTKFQQHAAKLKASHQARMEKLKKSWERAKETVTA